MSYLAALMRQTGITPDSPPPMPTRHAQPEPPGIETVQTRVIEATAAPRSEPASHADVRTSRASLSASTGAPGHLETPALPAPKPSAGGRALRSTEDRAERLDRVIDVEIVSRAPIGSPLPAASTRSGKEDATVEYSVREHGLEVGVRPDVLVAARDLNAAPPSRAPSTEAPSAPVGATRPPAPPQSAEPGRPPSFSDVRAWVAQPLLDEARRRGTEGEPREITASSPPAALAVRRAEGEPTAEKQGTTLEIGTIQITFDEPAAPTTPRPGASPRRETTRAAPSRASRHYLR
jgi:hypothetical protein